jgi:hypothetical protein
LNADLDSSKADEDRERGDQAALKEAELDPFAISHFGVAVPK